MNKAFEKILDGIESLKSNKGFGGTIQTMYADGMLDKAKEIVREVTEEYNNGWIPCNERLPEEHKLYDITFKNSEGIYSDSAIYNPYLKRWLWDADETELVENEVLAWAEKREPYRRKGG